MPHSVRQNIGGDLFVRRQEIAVRSFTVQQHVADDQQGPAIPKDIEAKSNRAAGGVFLGFCFHELNIKN